MKKLLQILSSFVIIGSTSTLAVACATPHHNKPTPPPVDPKEIKDLINGKLGPEFEKLATWDKTGGDIDFTEKDFSEDSSLLKDIESVAKYESTTDTVITQASVKKTFDDYILNKVKSEVTKFIEADKDIKGFFKSGTDYIKVSTSTYTKEAFHWNPDNASINPDQSKGEWFEKADNLASYKSWFDSTVAGKPQINDLFKIKAEVTFSVTYTIPTISGNQNLEFKQGSHEFYIVNDDAKPTLVALQSGGSAPITDKLKTLMMSYDTMKDKKNAGYAFNITNGAAELRKAFNPQITNLDAGIVIAASDPTNKHSEIGDLNYWGADSEYAFDKNFLNDPDLGSSGGDIQASMNYKDFNDKMNAQLDSNSKQFATHITSSSTLDADWTKEQAQGFQWSPVNFKTSTDIIGYGMMELSDWTYNNTIMPHWRLPYLVQSSTVDRATWVKNVSATAGTLFSTDRNMFFNEFTLGSLQLFGLEWGRTLSAKVSADDFNADISETGHLYSQTLDKKDADLGVDIGNKYSDLKDMATGISVNVSVNNLFDYDIANNYKLDKIIPAIGNSSTASVHPSWGMIQAKAAPGIFLRLGSYEFNFWQNKYETYFSSGLHVAE